MKKVMIFLHLFFKFLLKLSDFVSSDDCIGKIISKSIRIYQGFILLLANSKIFDILLMNYKVREKQISIANLIHSTMQQLIRWEPRPQHCIHPVASTRAELHTRNHIPPSLNLL